MPRINLTITDELFAALQTEANKKNIPVNLVAVETLEKLFVKETIDYSEFIKKLLDEIDTLPREQTEFSLFDLDTYNAIGMSEICDGKIKPSTLKARIGKAFNELERTVGIKGISRAYTLDKNGNKTLKFNHRAAVYVIDWSVREGK